MTERIICERCRCEINDLETKNNNEEVVAVGYFEGGGILLIPEADKGKKASELIELVKSEKRLYFSLWTEQGHVWDKIAFWGTLYENEEAQDRHRIILKHLQKCKEIELRQIQMLEELTSRR